MEKELEVKVCLYCEKPIDLQKGRKDRRFCDEICKNRFHNTKTWTEEKEIKRIQLVLKKNRRILKKMFGRKDKDEIAKERLLKEGFEFTYHTHFVKDTYKIIKVFENKEE